MSKRTGCCEATCYNGCINTVQHHHTRSEMSVPVTNQNEPCDLEFNDSNYRWLWQWLRNKREGRLNVNWFRNREFLWRRKWALRGPNTERGDKKAKWGHCLRVSDIYWDSEERKRGGRREKGGFLVQQLTSSQRMNEHFAQSKQYSLMMKLMFINIYILIKGLSRSLTNFCELIHLNSLFQWTGSKRSLTFCYCML